jgi:serine protease Do
MASATALTGALLFAAPGAQLNLGPAPALAQAQTVQEHGPAGFADIVRQVKPAVVSVRVKLKSEVSSSDSGSGDSKDQGRSFPKGSPFERFFREFGWPNLPNGRTLRPFTMAQGSGFFISPDGYAVTNDHVVNNADTVEIKTDAGKTYTAKVIGTDEKTDVALIKVEGGSNFPYVKFADHTPETGDWVIAVGNPFGLGGTVTAGIVSARGRDIGAGPYDDFLQIDAPVNKGNSGGPAFDEKGNVIGVTTAIYSPSGGSVGIGFAIPADTVKSVVDQLKQTGTVTRGWIGVQVQTVTQDIADSMGLKKAEGALVAEPQAGGPAAKSGIASGDLIQSVNGQEVKDSRDLAKRIAEIKPGSTAKLGLLHDGAEKTVSLTVEKMPGQKPERHASGQESEGAAPLGLTLAPAASVPGEGNKGVVVTDVNPAGPAAEHGVRAGDVILDVAGKPVNAPAEVSQALKAATSEGKHTVLMRIKTGDSTHFVAMPVAAG